MDCELARTLLLFQRPGELAPEDATGLSAHLAACPACAARSTTAQRFDRAVGAAFGAVPIPVGGRDQALTRVRALGAARFYHALTGWATVAASFVVVAGLAVGMFGPKRPTVDLSIAAETASREMENPEVAGRAFLARHDLPDLPGGFDWSLAVAKGQQDFHGRGVPSVTFVSRPNERGQTHTATVYAVTRSRFRFDGAQHDAQASFQSATQLTDPARPDVLWVVLFTSETLDPFKRKDAPA